MHCDVAVFKICMRMFGLYPHEFVQLVGFQTSPTYINININMGSIQTQIPNTFLNTLTSVAVNESANLFLLSRQVLSITALL